MFIELPDGRLTNPQAIETLKPNANMWRLTYLSGRTEDLTDEYAAVIREAVAAPKKQTRKTK